MKYVVKLLKWCLSLALVAVLILSGYVGYLQWQYYRIEDMQVLEVRSPQEQTLKAGETYNAVTYNVGFGAYSPEFTFFMDRGSFEDGELTHGKYAKAFSKAEVEKNINGCIEVLKKQNADFLLLQEVDEKAHKSHFVNQVVAFEQAFPEYCSVFAYNFHSAFLALPLHDMFGAVDSGLLTLSKYACQSAYRKSLPVDNAFITKFTDLDRCLNVTTFDVDNGKKLVMINAHLSAYDEGGVIRKQQFEVLNQLMIEQYEQGNYVIVGGDYNHELAGSKNFYPRKQNVPEWIASLNDDSLNEHSKVVVANNIKEVPTCRSCNIPYEKGVNFTVTIDGFIVSENVEAVAENMNTEFEFSDHNPVKLTFNLK